MLSPALSDLQGLILERGGLVILVFARASGCFALLPFFPKGLLPQQVRFALPIAMLPLLVIGASSGSLTYPPLSLALLPRVAVEFFVGVVISLPACILFWAARAAGEMVDIQTGANNQELYAAMTGGNDGLQRSCSCSSPCSAFSPPVGSRSYWPPCGRATVQFRRAAPGP